MVIGIGGPLEFFTGKAKRAPRLIQILCLEILYRLIKEPKLFRFKILKYINQLKAIASENSNSDLPSKDFAPQ